MNASLVSSLLAVLTAACLAPSPATGASAPSPTATTKASATAAEKSDEAPTAKWDASWSANSGGSKDGGMECVSSSDKHVALRTESPAPEIEAAQGLVTRLFVAPKGMAASFEWTWHTKQGEKFWSKTWCGGGLAFNQNWAAVDATKARYLVFYAKTSHPAEEVDLKVGLVADVQEEANKKAGVVSLLEHTPNEAIGGDWTRVIIPLSEYGEHFAWPRLQQVTFEPSGVYPENERVWVRINNIYLSEVEPAGGQE